MATQTRLPAVWQTVKLISHSTIQFVSGAVIRIFGLNDDDYPATGIQPFEGEPADDKHF